MNEITSYVFDGSNVRTLVIDGQPYFVGKDLAEILGYANTRDALSKHVDSRTRIPSQFTTVLNEAILTKRSSMNRACTR